MQLPWGLLIVKTMLRASCGESCDKVKMVGKCSADLAGREIIANCKNPAKMAVNLQTILESIRQKASGLAARCESLARASEEQEKRISDLTAENRALKEQVEQLKTDNEFLIVSHRLAQSPDEIVRSRRLISGWIRDIDRCISQLKE